ncbi:DUF5947 family protein [Streptomyces sp. NBC_00669]|uniref:DUF5947 family protein n=1 Tax=Streptomyces sp. NBC_00669 TaxID=2976011 RepID=UPI002E36C541|nr:DUF5947 family protein [Streptomyces sp. NBC_00669]
MLTGLRRFAAAARAERERPERCELCGVDVAPGAHRHLVDTEKRALACACVACALLFDSRGAAGGRFRAVPDRYLADPGHVWDDGVWERLQIPVGVAFFFRNAALDRLVAQYPSPAGATESELDPDTWQDVLAGSRLAQVLEPDVEALLVRRAEGRYACFLVPIDICYELVGRMRLRWQGFDGGAEARADLERFFAEVARRARPVPAEGRPEPEDAPGAGTVPGAGAVPGSGPVPGAGAAAGGGRP